MLVQIYSFRQENEKIERERMEKEKNRQAKKEVAASSSNLVNNLPNQSINLSETQQKVDSSDNESKRRQNVMLRDQWDRHFHKNGLKIKRL